MVPRRDAGIRDGHAFNGRGAPIIDSAAHAVETFRTLGLDFLILGDNLVRSVV